MIQVLINTKLDIYFKGDLEIEKVLFDDGQGNNKINDKNMMEDIKTISKVVVYSGRCPN